VRPVQKHRQVTKEAVQKLRKKMEVFISPEELSVISMKMHMKLFLQMANIHL